MRKEVVGTYLILLLLGCITLACIYITDLFFQYNEKRIFQLGILITGAGIFALSSDNFKKNYLLLPNKILWGGIAIFLLGILSSVFAVFPFYSIVEVSLYFLLLVLALIIAHSVKNYPKTVKYLFATASFFIFIYLVKFSVGYYLHLSSLYHFPLWPGEGLKQSLIGFSNIRFFNQVQVFTLPLIIGSTLYAIQRKKYTGNLLVFLSIFWWMLLFQSAGRGIILSLLISCVVVLIVFKKFTHRWIWVFIGTMAAGLLAKYLLFDLIADPTTSKSMVRGGSGRLTLWPKTLLASLDYPILGHGPMTFASLGSKFYRGHPHNSILQLLYEFGYPATILVLTGIYYGVKRWIVQTKDQFLNESNISGSDLIIRVSFTMSLFSGLLYSLLSGVIVMPLSQIWMTIIVGSVLGYYYTSIDSNSYFSSSGIYIIKICALVASGILIAVAIKDVPTFNKNEKKYSRETSSHTMRPRFWKQGKLFEDDAIWKDNLKEVKENPLN